MSESKNSTFQLVREGKKISVFSKNLDPAEVPSVLQQTIARCSTAENRSGPNQLKSTQKPLVFQLIWIRYGFFIINSAWYSGPNQLKCNDL